MVDKRTAELSPIFVLVGMVFLVPVITGEALGKTAAKAEFLTDFNQYKEGFPFHKTTIVEERLDEGKWVEKPYCIYSTTANVYCGWTTEGTGILGGAEAGHVIIKYSYGLNSPPQVGKVLFRWYNPRSGTNTCGIVVMERDVRYSVDPNPCSIGQGNDVKANYKVNVKKLY